MLAGIIYTSSSSPRGSPQPQAPDHRLRLPPQAAGLSPARVQRSCHEESVSYLPGCFGSPPRFGGRSLPARLCPTPRRRRSPRPLRHCFRGCNICRFHILFGDSLHIADSHEKSFDLTRRKLPETMASVRLVGKEVGDLSVELSDLSQELRKVVRSSLSIVHTADAQLRQLATSAQQGTSQGVVNRKKTVGEPLVATTVREVRELIMDIHSGFGAAFDIVSFFMWASKFWSKRPKNNSQ